MKRSAILFASLVFVAGSYGCKTTSSAESGSTKEAPAKSEKAVKSEPAAKPATANVPASTARDPIQSPAALCSGLIVPHCLQLGHCQ